MLRDANADTKGMRDCRLDRATPSAGLRLGIATAALLGMWQAAPGLLGQVPEAIGESTALFEVEVDLVMLNVAVTDQRGRYIQGLRPEHFRITEDGVQQTIASFGEGNVAPRRITRTGVRPGRVAGEAELSIPEAIAGQLVGTNVFVLFDTSNFMYRSLVYAEDAIADFIRGLDGADSVAVYSFSRNLTRHANLSADHDDALRGLRSSVAGDETALYNCLLLTLRDAARVSGRKVIIVFSNGPDNASAVSPDDVGAIAEDEGVPIYVISTRALNRDPISSNAFRRITQRTGGKAYFAKTWQRQSEAFVEIRDELASSYTVTYYPRGEPQSRLAQHTGRTRGPGPAALPRPNARGLPAEAVASPGSAWGCRDMSLQVIQRLQSNGYKAYWVGGCVRDELLGRPIKDRDVATDARPEQVVRLFKGARRIGQRFGVVHVREDDGFTEVATFRREGPYSDGRRPDEVSYTDDPEQDAIRRDFTVNAMFYDPVSNRRLDFTGGAADLESKLIRAVGSADKRFREDHLRMLRAVRLAAGLGFEIEAGTMAAIRDRAPAIQAMAAERVRDELGRILTEGSARRGFELLHQSGLLQQLLPEVVALRGVEQPPQYHPEGDVWTHTMLMLEGLQEPSLALAWGVLLHDVGKPETFTRADRIRFHGHVGRGVELAEGHLRAAAVFQRHEAARAGTGREPHEVRARAGDAPLQAAEVRRTAGLQGSPGAAPARLPFQPRPARQP